MTNSIVFLGGFALSLLVYALLAKFFWWDSLKTQPPGKADALLLVPHTFRHLGLLALVPQVVDAVTPIPVVAAGGIFDGRGIAAALMMGAAGVNLGTRFIATQESPAPQRWKQAIVEAKSEDAIKVDVLNDISPLPGTAGFRTVLRSLHTEFIDEWSAKRDEARRERERLKNEIVSTTQAGRPDATLLTAGQTAGGVKDIPTVAEIMRRLVVETETALNKAADLFEAA